MEDSVIRKLGNEISARSDADIRGISAARELLIETLPLMGAKWDIHLPAFLTAPSLARLLWLDSVYRVAIQTPGVFVEFGSQWGASFNTLQSLKLIHEPWNVSRRVLSFSTFAEGFTGTDAKDGSKVAPGDYSVAENWQDRLADLLAVHATKSPLGPRANFEIIPGDACLTFPAYLSSHPELLISHAHFDMDVYAPTKALLSLCLQRMPKGAVLIFDELNCPAFPGETIALAETLQLSGIRLLKSSYQPYSAFAIIGD